MYLLGWTLKTEICVFRIKDVNTEVFLSRYPDSHNDDGTDEWARVHLVAQDDRHYNVAVLSEAGVSMVEQSVTTGDNFVCQKRFAVVIAIFAYRTTIVFNVVALQLSFGCQCSRVICSPLLSRLL